MLRRRRERGPRHDEDGSSADGSPDPTDGHTPMDLEERLRNLEWPKPKPGVKERLLDDLLARLDENRTGATEQSGAQSEGRSRSGAEPEGRSRSGAEPEGRSRSGAEPEDPG